MGIDINFYDEIIYITSPTTTVTIQELVNAIRVAEDSEIGMNFEGVIDTEGKANLGGGAVTSIILTLNSNWYIEFWNGVSLGIVKDGNVVGGKDGKPIRASISSADTVLQLGAVGATIIPGTLTSQEHDALLNTQTTTQNIKTKTDTINWSDIDFLSKMEGGNWQIVNNQMIFRDSLNNEIARFNLYNTSNQLATKDVVKRVRV